MTPTKPRRTLGERAFEVEWVIGWTHGVPVDERDPDDRIFQRKYFQRHDVAAAFASEVLRISADNEACVTEVEWIDPYGDGIPGTYRWEYVGESEYFTGDDE